MKTVQQNVEDIAAQFGIQITELLGDDRAPNLVRARWVLMWVLRKRGMSLVQIGAQIGRDHSTVLHHLKKTPSDVMQDDLINAWADSIQGSAQQASVAREIIDINVLLQGSVAVESMPGKQGAVVAMALNRLQALAASAENLLRSDNGTQATQVQDG